MSFNQSKSLQYIKYMRADFKPGKKNKDPKQTKVPEKDLAELKKVYIVFNTYPLDGTFKSLLVFLSSTCNDSSSACGIVAPIPCSSSNSRINFFSLSALRRTAHRKAPKGTERLKTLTDRRYRERKYQQYRKITHRHTPH